MQDTDNAPEEGTLVETPESKSSSEMQRDPAPEPVTPPSAAPDAAPEAESKPQRSRKPRAPRAAAAPAEAAAPGKEDAPKPRRNIRKPRKPAETTSDEVTPSAAE